MSVEESDRVSPQRVIQGSFGLLTVLGLLCSPASPPSGNYHLSELCTTSCLFVRHQSLFSQDPRNACPRLTVTGNSVQHRARPRRRRRGSRCVERRSNHRCRRCLSDADRRRRRCLRRGQSAAGDAGESDHRRGRPHASSRRCHRRQDCARLRTGRASGHGDSLRSCYRRCAANIHQRRSPQLVSLMLERPP